MGVAGDDVRLQMLESLPGVSDLPRQVAKLPADVVLLVEMHGAQLVELAHLGVDSDFATLALPGGFALWVQWLERVIMEIPVNG
jgi:hypothetical protein